MKVKAVQRKAAKYPFTVSGPNADGQFIGFGAAQSIPADLAKAIKLYLEKHPADETSQQMWRNFLTIATRPGSPEGIGAQADRRARDLEGMLDYAVFSWNEEPDREELTGLASGF
jgi:hypothetical protein